jgi:hypothetical protein
METTAGNNFQTGISVGLLLTHALREMKSETLQ